jgi:HAD superfamily hydrolase (TIGR01459 family)
MPLAHTDGPAIPIVDGIAPLAATSDLWLVDIWGVMHNGVQPFAAAVEACRRYRAAGGTALLLSNAPRPAASVVQQLDRIGVARDAYDAIVTSGDAARAAISQAAAAGQRIGHLGPERDLGIYDGLAAALVALDDAGTVVCTGLFDDTTETPDSYAAVLDGLARRKVVMICANPDLTVERGGQIVYCAGAIAAAYEARGGAVVYAGKPHLPVYEMAFERAAKLRGGAVSRDRTLAIGDGIRTDIRGAANAGVRSVFVASGVHVDASQALDAATVAKLFPLGGPRPVAVMTGLRW